MTLLPPHACDCHTHVFLEPDAYPWSPARHYTPPLASVQALRDFHGALGIARVVIVQPSVYGADNAATLQALREFGARARGVAVIDDSVPDAELDAMHALGVRGVRVNLVFDDGGDTAAACAQLVRTAARVAPLGWHVQVYARLALLAACHAVLRTLPVPLVLDHYAGAQAAGGPDQEGLRAVLQLVEEGRAYVKLSAPYRLSAAPPYADLAPLARQFLHAGPDRMLWGSDWPHPQPGQHADAQAISAPFDVDSARVLDALRAWADDDRLFHRILVDNPARLYGFD